MKVVLWCCGCSGVVTPRLVTGKEVYPHRPDLYRLPFWKCDGCGNHVGCHHKSKTPTKPFSSIPTPEIRAWRKRIHALLDPLWQSGHFPRGKVYSIISEAIGKQYHTSEVNSVEEAEAVFQLLLQLEAETRVVK